MNKYTLKWLLPLVIIGAGVAIFVGLQATQPKAVPAVAKERSWRVATLSAEIKTLSPHLVLYGRVQTASKIIATAPKNSRVATVAVQEGDSISKGQLLLALDERDFVPQLNQALAQVAQLTALINSEHNRHNADQKSLQHELALLKLEQAAEHRAQMLADKKLGSTASLQLAQQGHSRQQLAVIKRQLALDDHSARLAQLQARQRIARAQVALAQLDLERSKVVAPFAGFVEQRLVSVGEQVKENQQLLVFYATGQLEVKAKIPAAFQHEIMAAIADKQSLTASAKYADFAVDLALHRLGGSADTRGIDGLFNITKGGSRLKPGAAIRLLLTRLAKQNSLALPYAAVYDNQRIYRVVAGRLQGVKVTILGDYLHETGASVLVSSPKLQNGDTILLTQLPNALEGLKVDYSP